MSNITDPETTVTTTSTATTTLPTTAEVTSIETTQTNPATTAAPDKPLGKYIHIYSKKKLWIFWKILNFLVHFRELALISVFESRYWQISLTFLCSVYDK